VEKTATSVEKRGEGPEDRTGPSRPRTADSDLRRVMENRHWKKGWPETETLVDLISQENAYQDRSWGVVRAWERRKNAKREAA